MWGDSIISVFMVRQFAAVVTAVTLAATVACRRNGDDAKPVATPSVTLSKATVPVGAPIDITYRFVIAPDAPPFAEDYVVFVHFLDDAREQMWTDDHEPVTPTRQWKPGETVEYTRSVLLPRYPYVGLASVEVGLYSPASGRRLPLTGDDVGKYAYRVASLDLTNDPEPAPVDFSDGWYDPESAGEGLEEWRWSKAEGVLTFKNPKRDATLFLQVDQAIAGLSEPQRIDIRLNGVTVDTFTLKAGVRELRRVQLAGALFGAGETGHLTIAVNQTVTPAQVPALRSPDRRELGIRVFRAYIQPK